MREERSGGRKRFLGALLFGVLLGLVLWDDNTNQRLRQFSTSGTIASRSSQENTTFGDETTHQRSGEKEVYTARTEEDEMKGLRRKLQPRKLLLQNAKQIQLNQFLHLHHMKTGGTSLDGLIHCGMQRLRETTKTLNLNYSNIHECGYQRYQKCIHGEDPSCVERIKNAGILSYCAPLHDLQPSFGWNLTIHSAITVLRHPVNRVWSMFRFQTKSCYSCRPLLEVYEEIDAGNSTLSENCMQQLLNHQTRNLLAEKTDIPDDAEQAEAAIRNMKAFFTMIGLTEDMTSTSKMVQAVFPWLAKSLDLDSAIENSGSLVGVRTSHQTCEMGHKNASPKNNRCLDGKHWDLPDHPDEATTAAILKHNSIDLKVYEAGIRLFEQQKQALNISP